MCGLGGGGGRGREEQEQKEGIFVVVAAAPPPPPGPPGSPRPGPRRAAAAVAAGGREAPPAAPARALSPALGPIPPKEPPAPAAGPSDVAPRGGRRRVRPREPICGADVRTRAPTPGAAPRPLKQWRRRRRRRRPPASRPLSAGVPRRPRRPVLGADGDRRLRARGGSDLAGRPCGRRPPMPPRRAAGARPHPHSLAARRRRRRRRRRALGARRDARYAGRRLGRARRGPADAGARGPDGDGTEPRSTNTTYKRWWRGEKRSVRSVGRPGGRVCFGPDLKKKENGCQRLSDREASSTGTVVPFANWRRVRREASLPSSEATFIPTDSFNLKLASLNDVQ